MSSPKLIKLLILDDQITPYRIPFFQRISALPLDLTVLYCSRKLSERRWQTPEHITFEYEILPHVSVRTHRPPYNDPRTILINPTLPLRLLKHNPDVVVGYAFSVPTIITFLYAKFLKRKFISWSTDTLHTERFIGPVQRLIRKVIIPRSDACITPSADGRDKYELYGADPQNIKVVIQAVNVELFWEGAQRARRNGTSYANRIGIDGGIILYVGFLSERKGVSHLVRAFNEIAQREPNSNLILAGEGPLQDTLKAIANRLGLSEQIHFLGHVSQDNLPSLYASADVFVLPTLEDTFGVVIAEAASCGLPVVTTPFAGAAGHYVKDGISGFIVDPRNEANMVQKLEKIVTDNELQTRMGKASLSIARENGLDRSVQAFAEAVLIARS